MCRRLLCLLFLVAATMVAVPTAMAQAQATPPTGVPAPGFVGVTHWINSDPLDMARLRGKVVLVDFWAFECVNCLHSLPHLKQLYDRYHAAGLEIVGVHTPELPVERDRRQLQAAVRNLGIAWPVAQDNEADTWNAWHVHYWPTLFLVDRQGQVVLMHIGEGDYAALENAVRQQLGRQPANP